VGRLFPDSLFYTGKRYIHTYFTKKWNDKQMTV
jgi:hypothetical protein